MRHTSAAALGLALSLLPTLALAEGKPLPPPSSDVVPPIELTITMKDGKPVCAPAELLVPANTNVALSVVSSADAEVTLTIPGQFANGLVLHADGDLVHVASEHGYLVKRNGKGTLKLRTEGPGKEDYACTSTTNQKAPFIGSYVRKSPAG
ncbi:cupredoxin domain-containing protein [Methylobacterium sp. J-076]|uniref:cupredoxin domain-containing protein n=1 Tax=Methylobacterium sp. J-076 TaxID=2836655 RepID=UPI001FB91712|nr:cupredoxin domain-containing protein [Methylobacterium sp. J-076]MCJ2015431.1 cupredoxin domain-containing protein [Methylobacterium sp. J-076]